tara:strand:- start:773 stop:1189 length:417 start_codon:yes stop_codon:yes gene_type:complete
MFLLGFVYSSIVEWAVHKYLFHELGKKKNSKFSFHIRDHHVDCRKNGNHDSKFSQREIPGILFLLLINFPIIFFLPSFYYAMCTYGALFIIMHNVSHIWPQFGKKYIPWHWDHHMKYQNHNFNVVAPIGDYIFGTRKK